MFRFSSFVFIFLAISGSMDFLSEINMDDDDDDDYVYGEVLYMLSIYSLFYHVYFKIIDSILS